MWSALQAAPELSTNFAIHWYLNQDSFQRSEIDALIFSPASLSEFENPDWSQWLNSPFPALCFLSENLNSYFLALANRFPWVQFILSDENPAAKEKALVDFINSVQHRKQDVSWGKELSLKTKELEELTGQLERKVLDSTEDIEAATKEEKQQFDVNGRFLVFLQNMLKAKSIEDAFLGFETAFKATGIGSQAFLLIVGPKEDIVVSQGVRRSLPAKAFTSQPINEVASRIGRPLLSPQMDSWELQQGIQAYLVTEITHPQKINATQNSFLQRTKDILQNYLKNWVLEDQIENFVHLWELAFDEMNEPIALITEDFKLLRANQQFVRNKNWQNPFCYEVFASRAAPCPGCPLMQHKSYSELSLQSQPWTVSSAEIPQAEGKKIFVHQYRDRSQEVRLIQQWVHSEKLAALGKLATQLAHELSNPLGGIRNQAQVILAEVPETEALGQDLKEVEKAATRSLKIISHLIEFAQGNSQEAMFSLKESVETIVAFLKTSLRGHRLELQLPEDDIQIFGNSQLFQQALFNLVNNGIQSMEKAGRIRIGARAVNNLLYIEIEDSGSGIPLEIQSKIFEPFFTTKAKATGTGLGLSLVNDVITDMQGRIYFHSQINQGTTFVVELPLQVQQ